MKLTPLDIKKQEFKRSIRGYDSLEVETFLEMVADEYETLMNQKDELQTEVQSLRTQLKDYQQVEQTLKETLMNAQESINRARANTENEANLIIHEAEMKAEKILEKSRRDLGKIKNELVLIRAQKESFAKRLKHLLESQLELIGVLEIDDLDFGELETQTKKEKEEVAPSQNNQEEVKEPSPKTPSDDEKPEKESTGTDSPTDSSEEDQMVF